MRFVGGKLATMTNANFFSKNCLSHDLWHMEALRHEMSLDLINVLTSFLSVAFEWSTTQYLTCIV